MRQSLKIESGESLGNLSQSRSAWNEAGCNQCAGWRVFRGYVVCNECVAQSLTIRQTRQDDWAGLEAEGICHGVEAWFLGSEVACGGEGTEGVAVAGMSADGEVDGFAHETEDDGVFADVIPGANGVVSDFGRWSFAGSSFAAVGVLLLAHLFGDDASELEGGAAGGIFFEAVVSFDDFDIDAIGVGAEDTGGVGDKFHDDIHGGAHAGGHENRGELGGFEDGVAEVVGDAGCGDDEWDTAILADGEDCVEPVWSGEVDHDIDVRGEFGGDWDVDVSGAGEFAGIASEVFGVGVFESGGELEVRGLESECDDAKAHATGGTVDSEFEGHGLVSAVGALGEGDVIADGGAGVDLAWSVDAAGVIVALFAPVCEPAGESSECEHNGEHICGYAHGAVEDTAVEVDVGVEFSGDEVVVFEGNFFEVSGDFEEWIGDAEFVEDLFGHFAEDGGAGVEVFVDAVSEAHESEGAVFVFGHGDIFFVVAAVIVDELEHFEDGLISAAVEGSPEGADAG